MIRDIGDLITLRMTLLDSSGVANNAATVALTVTKPDNSTITPAVTNTGSAGLYTASLTTDQAGTWLYRWTTSGAVVSVESDQFTVSAQRMLCGSMEEYKAYLRRQSAPDVVNDADLREDLAAATDWLEWRLGGPLAVTQFSERVYIRGRWISVLRQPIVAFVSLTPDLATPIDSSQVVTDTDAGGFRLLWGAATGWYTLVYTAGWGGLNARQKRAGLDLTRHLQLIRNGTSGRGYPGDEVQTPLGFAVPRRVDEMLMPDTIGTAGFA